MTTYRPGTYGGVCALPYGYALLYTAGPRVLCEVNGTLRWQIVCPETVMELWAAASPAGDIRAIVKGHDSGTAYEVRQDRVIPHGLTFGVQAVAIGWTGSGFTGYVFRSPASYDQIHLSSGVSTPVRYPAGTTSQGFLDILIGQPVFADLQRTLTPVAGLTLTLPQVRGALVIGQFGDATHPPQIAGVGGSGVPFTAILGDAFEPRIALLSSGSVAVCARTPLGVALALLPPFVPLVTLEEPSPGQPSPQPSPQPPQEPPMSIPDQRDRLVHIIAALTAAGHDLSGPNAGKIVKQLAYELRDLGCGRLSKPSGNNFEGCSVDWVVFPDGQAADCLGDAGGANIPAWSLTTDPSMIPRLVPQTTDPGYVTGGGGGGLPVPGVPPPAPPAPSPLPAPPSPPLDLSPLLAKLDQIDATLRATSAAEIAKLDDLQVHVITATREIVKYLPLLLGALGKGGLGGLLGDVLRKKP